MSEWEGGVGMEVTGVGREKLKVDRTTAMMRGVREVSRTVMNASFSSMIFVDGNELKVMVVEMEFGGMEAVARAEVSVEKMSGLVDWREVLNWIKSGVGASVVTDEERLDVSRLRLRWGCEVGGGVVEFMLRRAEAWEARSSSLWRRSRERSEVMDMSDGGRSSLGGETRWLGGVRG